MDNKTPIKEKIDSVMKKEFSELMNDPNLSPLLRMTINDEIEGYHNRLEDLIELLKKQDIAGD